MAIYIIKFGVLPLKKKEPKRATCGRCQTVFLFEDEDIAASMDDGTDVIKCPLCTNDVFYNISNSTISNVGQRKWRSFNSTDCMGRDPQMQIDRKLVEDAAKMLDRLCVALPIPSAKSGKFRELRGQASVVRAKISVALLKGILYDAD